MKGAFVASSESAKEIVTLSTLRLTTAEVPIEFHNTQLYLHEKADEMILGLPFTDGIGFNINTHLVENHDEVNGFDFDHHDEVKGASFDQHDEVSQVSRVRRIQSAHWAGECIPIQMNPRAPLDDADPLEEKAPCLTIGQVDPQEEEAVIIAMRDRAYDAVKRFKADALYTTLRHR